MKTIKEAGALIKYSGKLCEVVSYATGKVLFIRELGAESCECCGRIKEVVVLEDSPMFQENAEAVETLEN